MQKFFSRTLNTEKKDTIFDRIDRFFAKYPTSYLIWSFLLPASLLFFIYMRMGVYPFGSSSVLVLDLNGQYVQFFAGLRAAIYGDASFLYSFSRSLGGEFLGIYAYYLASPFSYIVALFPKKAILEALYTIFVLKCGCAGLSFGIFLHNTQKNNKTLTIAFSVLYALSSYSVVMHHNTMWMDAVIYLPLIALGVERLVKYKKPILYTVALSLTLMSNYYIGYMCCIFTLLYYIYVLVVCQNPLHERLHILKSFARMALYTVLGIGIAALILIPAYYSLTFGKTDFTDPSFLPSLKFKPIEFLAKLFPGAYDTVRPEGLPWIYSGVISLILLPVYFFTKKISLKEKIATGVFLLILILSMSISTLDLVWHGFQAPNWLNYRYSFMFSFLLLMLSAKAITLVREAGKKVVIAACVLWAAFAILLQCLNLPTTIGGNTGILFDPWYGFCLSLVFLAVYGLFLVLLSRHRPYSPKIDALTLCITVLICFETFFNGIFYTQMLHKDVVISNYDSYHSVYSAHESATEYVKENATEPFYRFERSFTRNVTDAFVFGTYGLASSTSTLDADVIRFLHLLGLKANSHWSEYHGSTPVTDSFFAIRYWMTKAEDPAPTSYQEYYRDESSVVYQNSLAFPLLFGANESVKDVSFALPEDVHDYEYDTESGTYKLKDGWENTLWNPFQRMNAILSTTLGRDVRVYCPIAATQFPSDAVKEPTYIWNHYEYTPYENDDPYACIRFHFTAPRDGTVYAYFPTKYPREGEVCVNNEFLSKIYEGNANIAPILNLGSFAQGEEVWVDVYIHPYNIFYLLDTNYFYYIDEPLLAEASAEISAQGLQITSFAEDSLEGTISVTEDRKTVLSTIPYDQGWQVYANGERMETYETLTCLLAFDLPEAGSYTITMKYFPNCYAYGIWCSGISLLLFVGIFVCILLAKKKKLPFGKKLSSFLLPLPEDSFAEEKTLLELEEAEEAEEAHLKAISPHWGKGKKQ